MSAVITKFAADSDVESGDAAPVKESKLTYTNPK